MLCNNSIYQKKGFEMKTKLTAGLLLTTLLAGSLYAGNCQMNNKMQKGNSDRSTCMMKYKKSHKDSRSSMGIFKELNLTADQKKKIKEIVKEARKNKKTINEAFTKDSFDKNKYISIMNEKRDNMLKSKAEIIEKSYEVLTAKQKEQLKVLMDLRKEKRDLK